jgi:hypothetical protein
MWPRLKSVWEEAVCEVVLLVNFPSNLPLRWQNECSKIFWHRPSQTTRLAGLLPRPRNHCPGIHAATVIHQLPTSCPTGPPGSNTGSSDLAAEMLPFRPVACAWVLQRTFVGIDEAHVFGGRLGAFTLLRTQPFDVWSVTRRI